MEGLQETPYHLLLSIFALLHAGPAFTPYMLPPMRPATPSRISSRFSSGNATVGTMKGPASGTYT